MKHLKLCSVVLGAFLLILGACQKEPQPPELIAPPDGAVFDSLPPTFNWSLEMHAEGYVIEVDLDSFDVGGLIGPYEGIWHYVDDHTYTLTQEEFNNLEDTTYFWHVASFWTEDGDTSYNWSEWRSFVIDKSPEPGDPSPPVLVSPENDYAMSQEFFDDLAEGTYRWSAATVSASGKKFWSDAWTFTITRPEPVTDLDTTYFPFGREYEWCYERHDHYWDIWGTEWDKYDTVIIQVEDSTYDSIGWLFDLSGYYYDVCAEGSEARIIKQSPKTFLVPICLNWWWLRDTVLVTLIPSPRTSPIIIEYHSDTLCMSSSCRIEKEFKIYTQSTKRLKRIGTVWQNDAEEVLSGKSEGYKKDRLLYFYDGQDTVYKAED